MEGRKCKWCVITRHINEIREWIGEGQTERQCANNLGISYSTWNRYKAKNPETAVQMRVPAGAVPGYLSKKTAATRLLFLYPFGGGKL